MIQADYFVAIITPNMISTLAYSQANHCLGLNDGIFLG